MISLPILVLAFNTLIINLKKNTYESVNEFLQLYGLPLLNKLITIGGSHLKKIKRTKRQKYMRRQKTKKTLNYNK